MKKIFLQFFLIILLIPVHHLHGYENDEMGNLSGWDSDQDIDQARDDGTISDDLAEEIQSFFENPVNANAADAEELSVVPGINFEMARNIVQERLIGGDYVNGEELRSRNNISDDLWRNIKPMIKVEPPVKFSGELYHETISQLDSRQQSPSPTVEADRLKMESGLFRAGASLHEEKSFAIAPQASLQNLSVQRFQQYRLVKAYLGYRPVSQPSNKSWIHQAYLGNYRLGIFEGFVREKSPALLPDTRLTSDKADLLDERKRSAPLRGWAVKLGSGKWASTLFYSNDRYPAKVPVKKGTDAKIVPLDDAMGLRSVGGDLTYALHRSRLAVFWIRHQADFSEWVSEKKPFETQVWGTHYRGQFHRIHLRGIFSRTNDPVELLPDSSRRNFYFGRVDLRPLDSAQAIFSHRRIEPGFFNPIGSIFSGPFIRSSFEWRQSFYQKYKLRFLLERRAGLHTNEKKASIRLHSALRKNISLILTQSYSDKTIAQESSGSTLQESESSVKAIYRPSEKLETRFGLDLRMTEWHRQQSFGERIRFEWIYRFSEKVELRNRWSYADPGLEKFGTENQIFRVELRTNPFPQLQFRLRWENRFQNNSAFKLNASSSDNSNVLFLRLLYRW